MMRLTPEHTTSIPVGGKVRQARYAQSEKGKEAEKRRADRRYLSRDFVCWDGEGITVGDTHLYITLANSEGNSITNPDGLSTESCFDFLLNERAKYPDAIHVGFAIGYDINMMLRDFTRHHLERVYSQPATYWKQYRIAWRQGKSLRVSQKDGRSITLFDAWPFFQGSFVKACRAYLGDDFEDEELIVENKQARSEFRIEDLETIQRYNAAELRNLKRLMIELRERLDRIGLRPSRWDGPGAIASALMRREGIPAAISRAVPVEPATAARYAYAGGRFEPVRFGHVTAPAYEYDINSAYPAALRNVPNLNRGRWIRSTEIAPFGIYRMKYAGTDQTIPGPLFCRHPKGSISYPLEVTGWYWTPETLSAIEYVEKVGGTLDILDGWIFEPDNDERPFAFIDELYLERARLKAAGDGAHVGAKLGLNSLYGKTAQQVGWRILPDGTLKIPPYHQLEYAGYTTSHARATILRAATTNIHAVIAFETDAIFSSEPLDVPIGKALGEFGALEFSDLTYVQSGLYFGNSSEGYVARTRGVDRGTLTRESVLAGWEGMPGDHIARAPLTRFIGAGLGLRQDWHSWRKWVTTEKAISLHPAGKREHINTGQFCIHCGESAGPLILEKWHQTFCPYMGHLKSREYPVEWINPNPDMETLSEFREGNYEDHDAD